MDKNEIIIYKNEGNKIEIKLSENRETFWATEKQIADIFEIDRSVVNKHINNIYSSEELEKISTSAIFAQVQTEGNREVSRETAHYNLDMVISVGYRINSKKATQFRKWATTTLSNYLNNGFVINKERLLKIEKSKLQELNEVIHLLKENIEEEVFEGREADLLSLIEDYTSSWSIFYSYDTDEINTDNFHYEIKEVLEYKKAKNLIEKFRENLIRKGEAEEIFGQELNEKLQNVIGTVNQIVQDTEIYKSIEEKAANLLYLIIKDHPFVDGNKRIASMLFIYFLQINNFSWKVDKDNGKKIEKKINDNALVALALLVATSDPKDKETMINLTIKLIQNDYVGKT